MLEETIQKISDHYETALGDMALTGLDTQSIAMDMSNTIDCDGDSAETSFLQAGDKNPCEDEEETIDSFWAIDGNGDDDSFSDNDLDDAAPMLSLDAMVDLSQNGNKLFRRHIDHRLADLPLNSTPSDLAPHATATVSKSGPSFVKPLKQLSIDDFLLQRGKENRPPCTALIAQSPSSRYHKTTSFSSSSRMQSSKRGRSGQAKAAGFTIGSAERKSVKLSSEATPSDDNEDFMPSRVTTKNAPIVKKVSNKKHRR